MKGREGFIMKHVRDIGEGRRFALCFYSIEIMQVYCTSHHIISRGRKRNRKKSKEKEGRKIPKQSQMRKTSLAQNKPASIVLSYS